MGDTKVAPKPTAKPVTRVATPAPAPTKKKVAAAPTPAPPAAGKPAKAEPTLGGIPSAKAGAPQAAKPTASKTPALPDTVKAAEKKAPVVPGSGYDIYHNASDKRREMDIGYSGAPGSSIWGDQYVIPPTPRMHNITGDGDASASQFGFNSDGVQNKDFNEADPNLTKKLQWSTNPQSRELGQGRAKVDALNAEIELMKSLQGKGPFQVRP